MLENMRTRQPNINTPRPANERRPAQAIPSEADKTKARLARIAALRDNKANPPGAGDKRQRPGGKPD
jgi:hypothetical protein